ncbi:hypothetical protein AAFF_G00305620 [Aldrovandia affinis]|uniref:C2H2-type domain-containing protein n=1 Tax=Aldrovandia affinis TaxID=143900 RepID=A0AAD7WR42_9TELE|nr:hypothetical protein AAFF_G00305620 [Aldrovandia affinis]
MSESTGTESSPWLHRKSDRCDDTGHPAPECSQGEYRGRIQQPVSVTYESVSYVSADEMEGDDALATGTDGEMSPNDPASDSDSDTGGWSSRKLDQPSSDEERGPRIAARIPCATPNPAAIGSRAQQGRSHGDSGQQTTAGAETASGRSTAPPTPPQKAGKSAPEQPAGCRAFPARETSAVEGDAENRPYKCVQCNWAFKKASNLLSHMDTHRGLKPHVCELCGKAYTHQGTLQQHKRLHTGERPYCCPFCDRTYIWSSDFRKHIRTHTGEKPYACGACGKDFVRSSDLRKHERNLHANNKPFPCPQCGKTFNKPLSLLRHQRSHLGERPFCCPDCGKDFAVASRMVEHQKTHSGARPYTCPVCFKGFSRPSSLAEHQAVHSSLRPFRCTVCGGAFTQASRLARHQRVHTGERPYECPACGLSFSRPATLRRHQLQHCSERGSLHGGSAHRDPQPAQLPSDSPQSHQGQLFDGH